VLAGVWVEVVALVAAFVIAVVTTPAGVSGAVLLLPFQVSVLGTPSPSVTPTNLLYNVVACPGAMWRYWRQGQTGGSLTWLLLAGTLPGVIAGSAIRVFVLPGPVVFDFVVAAVLIPLGAWLALTQVTPAHTTRQSRLPRLVIGLLAGFMLELDWAVTTELFLTGAKLALVAAGVTAALSASHTISGAEASHCEPRTTATMSLATRATPTPVEQLMMATIESTSR